MDNVIGNGATIRVTAEVFDALRHAGLLVAMPNTQRMLDGTTATWTVWGERNEDDSITCTLCVPTE